MTAVGVMLQKQSLIKAMDNFTLSLNADCTLARIFLTRVSLNVDAFFEC